MVQSLSWKDFEIFCAYLLKLYGCTSPGVTRSIKEEGIDFYGIIECNSLKYLPLFSRVMQRSTICVIGQAKKWKNKIGEDQIKKFANEYENFRKDPSSYKTFLPETIINCDQIYPVIITTSFFTKGAEKLAQKSRIYLRDGEQIVEDLVMLAPLNELSIWYSWEEKEINSSKFFEWLESIANVFPR